MYYYNSCYKLYSNNYNKLSKTPEKYAENGQQAIGK